MSSLTQNSKPKVEPKQLPEVDGSSQGTVPLAVDSNPGVTPVRLSKVRVMAGYGVMEVMVCAGSGTRGWSDVRDLPGLRTGGGVRQGFFSRDREIRGAGERLAPAATSEIRVGSEGCATASLGEGSSVADFFPSGHPGGGRVKVRGSFRPDRFGPSQAKPRNQIQKAHSWSDLGGGRNSGARGTGPVGQRRATFCEMPELFSGARAAMHLHKTPRNSGWGGYLPPTEQ